VILLAVDWYLRFSLSYRDVEELLADEPYAGSRVETLRAAEFSGLCLFTPSPLEAFTQARDEKVSYRQVCQPKQRAGSDDGRRTDGQNADSVKKNNRLYLGVDE
jgi:hypothetical protein